MEYYWKEKKHTKSYCQEGSMDLKGRREEAFFSTSAGITPL